MREAPNPRTQIPGKSQFRKFQWDTASATFEIEALGFPWDLVLGIWDFQPSGWWDWNLAAARFTKLQVRLDF
jgi:hypothetical protein